MPHIKFSGDYLAIVVAIFGTTISPYLFFWQAAEEVEDEKEDPKADPLIEAPLQAAASLRGSNLICWWGWAFPISLPCSS